ncbi:MAG: agmatine deiminase family protein [Bacteroidales bacterium]|nr:agmatine deiminase family protein [Bacteroidales bacterium]MBN2819743.1 agmatine deiminase family protein [Bacteroidales bacterium]
MLIQNSPLEQGFFFPAEWEVHEATWLTYPKPNESWPSNFEAVCDEYNRFASVISQGEAVKIVCDNTEHSRKIAEQLDKLQANMSQISFHSFGSNDSWCRDHGPAFLQHKTSNKRAIVKWEFNAWGEKYPSNLDNEIGNKIAQLYNFPVFRPGIVMEGGSIEVNGKGTLLTTTSCLENANRNSKLSKPDIEEYLKHYYGVTNIIWLNNGIEGDDTDGHIDDITRFVSSNEIIVVVEQDKKDKNYSILKENIINLEKSVLENGEKPELIELIMPESTFFNKDRLPASYANFYICNSGVIVPVFGTKNDDKALETIQKCFPEKEVIGLLSKNVIYGLGSWHCLSQQVIK